jgi:hypothetical protein
MDLLRYVQETTIFRSVFRIVLQAVVLFIDLCHQKAGDRPDLEIRRVQLREALNMFK